MFVLYNKDERQSQGNQDKALSMDEVQENTKENPAVGMDVCVLCCK